MATPQIESIVARFPGPAALYPSRRKWLLVFAGCALFVAGGAGMIASGEQTGWFVLIVFGLFAATAAVMLLPGAGSLTLDGEGFETVSLFRRRRARWQDVTEFKVVRIPPSMQRMVVYDDRTLTGGIAKLNAAIAGKGAGLPDTYGLSADEIARLMSSWRDRALALHTSP
jgi:hypothetical protein